jgi:hypothetical protein
MARGRSPSGITIPTSIERIDPSTGEDPGLLPLTEDPLERRLKRNTM